MNLPLAGLKDNRSKINVKDTTLGGKEIIIIGGPCAVESKEQMRFAAKAVQESGGRILRGGVYKPRTSPYNFQGLGEEGIAYLADAAEEYGLLSVTEVMDEQGLAAVMERVDIVQVGARNMQNFQLLKKLGTVRKPVILKRGLSATIEEWLYAAEYILAGGNEQVILCERGIRTFETSTRNTLDLSAVSLAKEISHLPVIVDPSHAAGRIDLIPSLARAAIAVGADGLIIEMHPNPAEAQCDGAQSLTPDQFRKLLQELQIIARSVNRELDLPVEETGIEPLRKRINLIDQNIVQLLADRMKLVKKIGKHKNPDHIRDGKREAEILQKLENWATEVDCPSELLKQIYPLIFDCSIQIQLKGNGTRAAEYVI
jgi:3-deoxy-7-phosphoheptulonate synthase